MLKFNRSQIIDLKEYLYNCYIHDAKIENFQFDRETSTLTLEATNSFFDYHIYVIFKGIKAIFFMRGCEIGSYEKILSLSVEEDYSYFQNCTKVCEDCFTDSLYLLFQMFSGDELHIVSEKVFIENLK